MADDPEDGQPAESDDKPPLAPCPDCEGKGVTPTLEANVKTRTIGTYGRLCMTCNGTGEVPVSKL